MNDKELTLQISEELVPPEASNVVFEQAGPSNSHHRY